jgi:hypothetical protein
LINFDVGVVFDLDFLFLISRVSVTIVESCFAPINYVLLILFRLFINL